MNRLQIVLCDPYSRGASRQHNPFLITAKNEVSRNREARDYQAGRASHLPAKRTLDQLGIPRRTFYRWYDRYRDGGPEGLADRPSAPSRVWNRIPSGIQDQIVELALDRSELSPRELAIRFTDEKRYFVSEATVYRLLKAHDLITSPAYVVIKAADRFHTQTTRPNEMWQTDFTYFKIIGWGWMYLSTVLDDYSRYIIAGDCAARCGPKTSPTRSTWPLPRQAATRLTSGTSPGCSATMGPATSRANWPITSQRKP